MRLPWVYLCLSTLLWAGPAAALPGPDPAAEVEPFIGTAAHGHTYPGATLPFGAVQLSPDTRPDPWDWDGCSGYHLGDPTIYGFSHTHLSGTGIPDGCDILLAPHSGEARLGNGRDGTPGYGSRFDHASETAEPGFYSVLLKDFGIKAELTASERCGFHRYSYPPGRSARITLDLTHRDPVLDSGLRFLGDRELQGWRRSRSWAQDQTVYFVARFSRPFREWGLAVDGEYRPGLDRASGTRLEAHMAFGEAGGPLLVKVGISAVDLQGARRNLDQELPGWDFEAVRGAATRAWNRQLSRVAIEGGAAAQRRAFYTALYHASLAPTLFQDVDGRYRGRDLKVHAGDGAGNYSVFSLWDTFRAEHPLLTLIDRKRTGDFLRTFLRQYEQGGRLPVWELWGNETDCMIGYHAVSVMADAILKGVDAVDPVRALEAMEHSAEEDRAGLGEYRRLGYIPVEADDQSVSRTLEYAYDDWCIAQVALKLGRTADWERYQARAGNYRNLFDPATGFFRGRLRDGSWWTPFDPFEINSNYTEANAWQYSCFVPQDMAGFMALHGGPGAFARKLDALFDAPSTTTGRQQPDETGMIGQCAHGNEPSHHLAYLYAFAGEPWKTQAVVRRLQLEMYSDRPDGLVGNDDCGQMSAWYVLSALGLYAVTPGSTTYVIGSPLFPRATLNLENGRQFVVRAPNAAPAAPYIQSAALNGRPYSKPFLDCADILAGGELVLVMGEKPNPGWGAGPGDRE
jgi:predicted alpha-1,2-mannosidase